MVDRGCQGPGPGPVDHHCHGHDTGTVTVTVSGPTQTLAPGVAGPVRVTDGPGRRIARSGRADSPSPTSRNTPGSCDALPVLE